MCYSSLAWSESGVNATFIAFVTLGKNLPLGIDIEEVCGSSPPNPTSNYEGFSIMLNPFIVANIVKIQ